LALGAASLAACLPLWCCCCAGPLPHRACCRARHVAHWRRACLPPRPHLGCLLACDSWRAGSPSVSHGASVCACSQRCSTAKRACEAAPPPRAPEAVPAPTCHQPTRPRRAFFAPAPIPSCRLPLPSPSPVSSAPPQSSPLRSTRECRTVHTAAAVSAAASAIRCHAGWRAATPPLPGRRVAGAPAPRRRRQQHGPLRRWPGTCCVASIHHPR
jgi:hypothetical protein